MNQPNDELKLIYEIFQKGSRTYYNSSRFFSKKNRDDTAKIYAFVRVPDDYVDRLDGNGIASPDIENYNQFKLDYQNYLKSQKPIENYVHRVVIENFVSLFKSKKDEEFWTDCVDAFFKSMDMDLKIDGKIYKDFQELENYIYGSASVVGLMFSKQLNLDERSYPAAKYLAMSMQLANFIRDIDEDNKLGRTYIPTDLLKKYRLDNLDYKTVKNQPEDFKALINELYQKYNYWYELSKPGLKYIKPYLAKVAVVTASQKYDMAMRIIKKDPFIIYKKKVKPTKRNILATGFFNLATLFLRK